MSYEELSIWLVDTPWGIVILGAAGSALFVGFVKGTRLLLQTWLPWLSDRFVNWKLDRAYSLGKALGRYKKSTSLGGVSIIIYKSFLGIIYTVISSTALILFLLLYLAGAETLTLGSYVLLVISMVLGFYAYTEYRELRLAYKFFTKHLREEDESQPTQGS